MGKRREEKRRNEKKREEKKRINQKIIADNRRPPDLLIVYV